MIGDEAERREKAQEELKRKENRRALSRLGLRASSALRFSSTPFIYLLTCLCWPTSLQGRFKVIKMTALSRVGGMGFPPTTRRIAVYPRDAGNG